MHVDWKHLAIALAVLPVAALLFAWIGFFNVGASSGHWQITEWFLRFAMQSAVRTYALAVDEPETLPRQGIQPAAAHFARGCSVCHGAPGEPRSPAVMRMLPLPPDLSGAAAEWKNPQLFRLAKHGIRFTGMPAWPTQSRDDEVWAMVAFLREYPSLDAKDYRGLAYGEGSLQLPAETWRDVLDDCARCHGHDGIGRSDLVPNLAGQSEAYLRGSLEAYAQGRRPSGVMALPATAATPESWPELARYYGSLTKAARSGATDKGFGRGRLIAERGIPERGLPACLSCHGGSARNPAYPRLEAQKRDYLEGQLRLFREGTRGGTAYSHLMRTVAGNLSDQDIADAAAYFSDAASRD